MIDHTGVQVSDVARSKAFYRAALEPLGYRILMELAPGQAGDFVGVGFGVPPKPDFWIGSGTPRDSIHIAFSASDRAQVDAFYAAAMSAGGRDNGPPGVRPHYHPNYYGAFVLDPDGHNIEAVCHKPA
ncbi:MAG: VOC family protein [Candidatus Eremiobacterota bacterium]